MFAKLDHFIMKKFVFSQLKCTTKPDVVGPTLKALSPTDEYNFDLSNVERGAQQGASCFGIFKWTTLL